VVAFVAGGRGFALKVIPGVALMVVAAWLGLLLNRFNPLL
jgi:hypothetical protein